MPNGTSFSKPAPSRPVAGAGWALALLLSINLLNYIDRQILSATLPKINLDTSIIASDDQSRYTKLGLLTTAFMVSYMCLSPVFGRLGDTISRWLLIGLAVIGWSLATGGTGLAAGYWMLFLTRCLVGIGEAAYGPIAPAMLSDLYPVDHRGRIMSWFYMAIPVGSALGFVIGGQVAGTWLGWRGAFYVVVVPGLILGILCFFMKNLTDKSHSDEPDLATSQDSEVASTFPVHSPSYWSVLKELKSNRSFVLCCAGMTASTFVLGGVATVMQLYLFEREARFQIQPAALEKLRTEKEYRRSDGSLVVPEAVIDRLEASASPEEMTAAQLKKRLETTDGNRGLLSQDEYEQYQSQLFAVCTAPHSLTNDKIGPYMGGIVVISGLIATLLGGLVGDYLRNRGVAGAYFQVSGWGMIVAFPFFLGMLFAPMPLAWVLLFVSVFFMFFNTGPANTILANVTRPRIRATAFAINILIIHALGDAISPLIIGRIADYSSLQDAFIVTSFLILVSGVLWIWGARYLEEDTQRAEKGVEAS